MNNTKLRINNLDMSMMDVVFALSGGNPGAVRALLEILTKGEKIDPQAFDPAAHLFTLDMLGVYEDKIWVLYKYICDESVGRTIALIRATQLGILPPADLLNAIEIRDEGIDKLPFNVTEIVDQVCERLTQFSVSGLVKMPTADSTETIIEPEVAA